MYLLLVGLLGETKLYLLVCQNTFLYVCVCLVVRVLVFGYYTKFEAAAHFDKHCACSCQSGTGRLPAAATTTTLESAITFDLKHNNSNKRCEIKYLSQRTHAHTQTHLHRH